MNTAAARIQFCVHGLNRFGEGRVPLIRWQLLPIGVTVIKFPMKVISLHFTRHFAGFFCFVLGVAVLTEKPNHAVLLPPLIKVSLNVEDVP